VVDQFCLAAEVVENACFGHFCVVRHVLDSGSRNPVAGKAMKGHLEDSIALGHPGRLESVTEKTLTDWSGNPGRPPTPS
jgi:hypothetical protein